jgi:acetyl esterase/lipase/DNA-binding FadR family transcriptional regulator
MALLLDRWSGNQAPGIVAPDLAATIARVEATQQHLIPPGRYELAAFRAWIDEYATLIIRDRPPIAVPISGQSFATSAGPMAARVYTPRDHHSVIVFVHGGGWVMGSVNSHDHICRWLAVASESQVISLDYALAPEHPYPTAVTQVAAALAAILARRGGDERSVFVAGDSAGANIAAMAILAGGAKLAKEIAGFISIYGAYSPQLNLSSHRLYSDGRFGLSEAQMQWFWNLYAPHIHPAQRDQLTPLGADLGYFPPTLCVAAECDLLLDDTIAFYSGLAKAGIDVSLSLWSGINHGALHFVEIVESVTSAANAIVRYVDERRHRTDRGTAAPATSLAQVVLQTPPPGSLSATVLADPDAKLRRLGAAPFAPIESAYLTSRARTHGSIAHRLATEIVGGVHPEGSLLPNEDNASAAYGVSRSAYREAIRTLAAKGMVSATPKVGTKITPRNAWRLLDPDVITWHFEANCTAPFIRNLFEMRKVVEPSAAALAAARRDEQALSKLADTLARMAKLNPRDRDWPAALLDFHEIVLTTSGNELLAAMWPPVQVTLQWAMNLQMSQANPHLVGDPVADHAKVFESIAAQNAEKALKEMAYLVDGALADTIAALEAAATPARKVAAQ